MFNQFKKIGFTVLLSALCTSAMADIVVVAHPSASDAAIIGPVIKKIYMGRMNTFPSGNPLVAVEQPSGSATMQEFHSKVTKKTPDQLRSYWAKMVLSGKGIKLGVLQNDAEVKAWVASHPDGLGYIDASQVDGSVKVVYTLQ